MAAYICSAMRRVVITGVGAISVLGQKREDIAKSLYLRIPGIVLDLERQKLGFRSALTGQIKDFACSLSKKQKKTMPVFVQQSYVALKSAIEQANLTEEDLEDPRTGLIFGNDSSLEAALQLGERLRETTQTQDLGSQHLFRIMNSTASMNLGLLFKIHGCAFTVSGACASGLIAIGQAYDRIRLDRADIMLAGAAQELGIAAAAAFDGLGAFSVNPDPQAASRPFDAKRDGLVPSGGACAIVLEEYTRAKKRGVPILGEIIGFGLSSDGSSLVQASEMGLASAIQLALADAKIDKEAITEINAHATSTLTGDAKEAINLRKVFGEKIPPLITLKSLTGHEFWMSGAGQVVYAAIMYEHGFLAGSPNFTEGVGETLNLPVITETLNRPPKMMLCEAQGFGGCNAALVIAFPCRS